MTPTSRKLALEAFERIIDPQWIYNSMGEKLDDIKLVRAALASPDSHALCPKCDTLKLAQKYLEDAAQRESLYKNPKNGEVWAVTSGTTPPPLPEDVREAIKYAQRLVDAANAEEHRTWYFSVNKIESLISAASAPVWRPIDTADPSDWVILHCPMERDPANRIRIGCPDWVPHATHWLPLDIIPAPPATSEG